MIRVSVPAILESDPPDVVDALRTAQRVYRNEPLDAIDWVRQAAQLAQDAGLDARGATGSDHARARHERAPRAEAEQGLETGTRAAEADVARIRE